MTFLRHAPRHVHQSVVLYIWDQLTQLGWVNTTGSGPFGLPSIKLIESRPFIGGQLDNKITPGTVAITMGNEMSPDLEELGGPLSTQEYPIFCDVFMDGEGAAMALASDIRDAFLGRHATSKRVVPVINQITGTVEPDWKINFENIQRIAPEHTFPLSWHSVHVTAETNFMEVLY